uniref:Liprin-beta-1/2 coiled-coil domain-containing protein n=1 Tax=Plectus sambesii TaxID=2011161 RepID=A0A914UL09_9BILA
MGSLALHRRLKFRAFQSPSPSMSTVSCPEYPELQEKLHRLAMARESLSLQVSVLTEQVGAQTEKIKDLESLLENKRQKLDSTEEVMQEASKMDLMAEVSNLKLKFANLERQKMETEHRLRISQVEIDHLTKSMQTTQRQVQMQQHGQVPSIDQNELTELVSKFRQRTGEIEQLRMAVQQLLNANEEKNMQIDTLRSLVVEQQMRGGGGKYPVGANGSELTDSVTGQLPRSVSGYDDVVDFDINQQLRKLLTEDTPGDFMPASSSYPEGFYYGVQQQQPLRMAQTTSMHGFAPSAVQSSSSYTSSLSAMSASPQQSWSGTPRHQQYGGGTLLAPSVAGGASVVSQRSPSSPAARQLAAELDELRRGGGSGQQHQQQQHQHPVGPSQYYTGSLPRTLQSKKTTSMLTLPRKKGSVSSSASGMGVCGELRPPRPPKSHKSSGGGLNWVRSKVALISSKRSTSAPNLVESDDEMARGSHHREHIANFKRDRTRSSLRNLLGK